MVYHAKCDSFTRYRNHKRVEIGSFAKFVYWGQVFLQYFRNFLCSELDNFNIKVCSLARVIFNDSGDTSNLLRVVLHIVCYSERKLSKWVNRKDSAVYLRGNNIYCPIRYRSSPLPSMTFRSKVIPKK